MVTGIGGQSGPVCDLVGPPHRREQRFGAGHELGHHLPSDLERVAAGITCRSFADCRDPRRTIRPTAWIWMHAATLLLRDLGRQHQQGRARATTSRAAPNTPCRRPCCRSIWTCIEALPILIDGYGNQYSTTCRPSTIRPAPAIPTPGDPFGGNNGLNQAIWDPGRPGPGLFARATATPTTWCSPRTAASTPSTTAPTGAGADCPWTRAPPT